MSPKILGLGYSVPSAIRLNDDPIFDWLKANEPTGSDLFKGYVARRVLSEGEDLMTMMLPAAQNALAAAGMAASDVDLLIGTGSVSPYETPNALCQLHQLLQLREDVWILPQGNSFTQFNSSLLLADSMIRAGRCKNALICVGGNWTRHVDYHTSQAISAADGAGAAVMGLSDDPSQWEVVDTNTITWSQYYGSMFMAPYPYTVPPFYPSQFSDSVFQITQTGISGFQAFGETVPPEAALALLSKHGIAPADVTLISHQASSVLLEAWNTAIAPGQYIWTLEEYANMVAPNIPVTLAWAGANMPITKNNLLLLGIGVEMHTNALLLQRMTS